MRRKTRQTINDRMVQSNTMFEQFSAFDIDRLASNEDTQQERNCHTVNYDWHLPGVSYHGQAKVILGNPCQSCPSHEKDESSFRTDGSSLAQLGRYGDPASEPIEHEAVLLSCDLTGLRSIETRCTTESTAAFCPMFA